MLLTAGGNEDQLNDGLATDAILDSDEGIDGGAERASKKKKPTPENSNNSAAAASQPCQEQ